MTHVWRGGPLELKVGQNIDTESGFYRWIKLIPHPLWEEVEICRIGKCPPCSYLDFEDQYREALGIETRHDHDPCWIPTLMVEHAIAPGQPFLAHLSVRGYRDYWGEYDEEWECEILDVVPYMKERSLRAWERLLEEYAETRRL